MADHSPLSSSKPSSPQLEQRRPSSRARGPPLNPDEATKMLNEEHIIRLTEDAFKKLAMYTKNELDATVDDCQLLEAMNKTTKDKYSQMSQMSQRLTEEMSKLQNTYADFSTFMAQIDDINNMTIQMEKTARALDEYSRYLEQRLSSRLGDTTVQ